MRRWERACGQECSPSPSPTPVHLSVRASVVPRPETFPRSVGVSRFPVRLGDGAEKLRPRMGAPPSGNESLLVPLGASMPRPALWTVGWLSGATCLSVAFLDGPAGGPRLEPGRAGQLLNALGLWKEAVWERRLGEVPQRSMGSHLGFLAWDGRSPLGNTMDLENSYWNPREVTWVGGGLSPLAWGENLPSPAEDFKQSHDRSHGSTCSSQVQGQNARTQAGLVTARREPRPPPQTRNTPPVCLAKDKCWLVGADSHFMGVVLISEVLNELRKHKQMMRDIHPCT